MLRARALLIACAVLFASAPLSQAAPPVASPARTVRPAAPTRPAPIRLPRATAAGTGLLGRWQRALPGTGQSDVLRLKARRADALSDLVIGASKHKASAVDSALDALEREPARDLKMIGVAKLLGLRKSLTGVQKQRYEQLTKEVFPKRPLVPDQGEVEVRHLIGEEFYAVELQNYRRTGYSVRTVSATEAVAEKGRLRVVVRKGDEDVLRDMADPKVHVVVYSGHSDVGGVIEGALRTAPAQKGAKMVVALQCIGIQTMPMILGKYDKAQVVTTKQTSYASEDMNMLTAILEGIDKGHTFSQIRSTAAEGDKIGNYLFPDQVESALHWDLDRNGRPDVGWGELSDPRIQVRDERSRQGQRILSAVGYLNASHDHYATDTPGAVLAKRQVAERFVSGGLGKAPAGRMTAIRPYRLGNRDVFQVVLNQKLANQPKAFVAAASIFEMHEHLVAASNGKVTPRDQLRALLFSADYLLRLVDSLPQAEAAMSQLARMKGFPRLGYGEMEDILLADHELATPDQIDRLEKLMTTRGWKPAQLPNQASP